MDPQESAILIRAFLTAIFVGFFPWFISVFTYRLWARLWQKVRTNWAYLMIDWGKEQDSLLMAETLFPTRYTQVYRMLCGPNGDALTPTETVNGKPVFRVKRGDVAILAYWTDYEMNGRVGKGIAVDVHQMTRLTKAGAKGPVIGTRIYDLQGRGIILDQVPQQFRDIAETAMRKLAHSYEPEYLR